MRILVNLWRGACWVSNILCSAQPLPRLPIGCISNAVIYEKEKRPTGRASCMLNLAALKDASDRFHAPDFFISWEWAPSNQETEWVSKHVTDVVVKRNIPSTTIVKSQQTPAVQLISSHWLNSFGLHNKVFYTDWIVLMHHTCTGFLN
jgi:hypothetical protein